jgi:glutamate 5-kinase
MTDLLRQEIAASATTVVVKVGTRVLSCKDGRLDTEQVARLAEELAGLLDSGRKVVLVSSGAVGAGMGRLGIDKRPTDLAHLQAVAAVGQSHLVQAYDEAFAKHGRHAAQVLLTADDLQNRSAYLNVRNTLMTLLEYGAVPVINENDTVSVDELATTFGDNDRLAAMVTNSLRAPLLVILSDVEGLYDGDPSDEKSKIIPTVEHIDDKIRSLVNDTTSGPGKGGMASKLEAARVATAAGENVIICSGRRLGVLADLMAGKKVGTLFIAQGPAVGARKRWIGFAARSAGHLVLDDGACRAVVEQGRSLLAIGIAEVRGQFNKGDVVVIQNASGSELARGLTNYSSPDLTKICGLKTDQIIDALGHRPYDEVVHRDNLAVTG